MHICLVFAVPLDRTVPVERRLKCGVIEFVAISPYNIRMISLSKPFLHRNELTRLLMLLLESDVNCREIEHFLIEKRKANLPLSTILISFIKHISRNGLNVTLVRNSFNGNYSERVDLSNGFDYVL